MFCAPLHCLSCLLFSLQETDQACELTTLNECHFNQEPSDHLSPTSDELTGNSFMLHDMNKSDQEQENILMESSSDVPHDESSQKSDRIGQLNKSGDIIEMVNTSIYNFIQILCLFHSDAVYAFSMPN